MKSDYIPPPFLTLPEVFLHTLSKHPTRPAFGFVDEVPWTYDDFGKAVKSQVLAFQALGFGFGDRIAILAANSPQWACAFIAIHSIGAIAVPLLPDFTAPEITNIIEHSGSKAILVSEGLKTKLNAQNSGQIRILDIDNVGAQAVDVEAAIFIPKPNDLAAIIYTSGTTGRSKGVMLTHANICSNAWQGSMIQDIQPEDRFLSVLPLSHTLENTLGLVLPLMFGASVSYLRKPPSASVLLPALSSVRPTIMLTVPLIIEKVFRNSVLPKLQSKALIRALYRTRTFKKLLHRVAGKKLYQTFGGALRFYGIGGAKLNAEVEQFLIDARFPYAIGYGLTETSPLLAGATPGHTRLESTGPAIPGVEFRLHQPDPDGLGEIWAKGPNVMQGYYREPEITAEVLTEDGWFRTGDMGYFDKDGYLFIKGRSKSLILGASGENIYPEDIEFMINNYKHVVESLVVEQKGKLVALVHFNREEIEQKYQHIKHEVVDYVEHKIEELRHELNNYVNSRVKKFSRLHSVNPHPEPFKRTATQKIKRYLYEEKQAKQNSKA
jgi:long-chain acyl-CoA synthetase